MKILCAHTELKSIKDLKPHPKNRNKHSNDQIERLAKILKYQGWRRPVRVSNLSGFITAGHGAVLAARKNNWTEVPVDYQDYENEEQEYADVQADNAIAAWAELDLSAINLDLPDLGPDFDIDMLGLRDFEIEPADKYGDKDADAIPESKPTDIKIGDCFALGRHRLLCGDSTDKSSVDFLMNGEKADMVFTDPPYNLKFKYNSYDDDKIPEEYQLFCFEWFKNIQTVSTKQIITPGTQNLSMWLKMADPKAVGIWIKKNWMSGGLISNLQQWEPILFFGPCERTRASDLFEINRKYQEDVGDSHTCAKQIELLVDILNHWANGSVLDVFGGSGSTLIACEKTNRKCFGMEIDPQYCQVIIDRFEKFTGQKAVKLES